MPLGYARIGAQPRVTRGHLRKVGDVGDLPHIRRHSRERHAGGPTPSVFDLGSFQIRLIRVNPRLVRLWNGILPAMICRMAGLDGDESAAARGRHFVVRNQFALHRSPVVC
jgi:hypothetical protein